jgi:hypothetical protein
MFFFESAIRTREQRDKFVAEIGKFKLENKTPSAYEMSQLYINSMNHKRSSILDICSSFEAPPTLHVLTGATTKRNIVILQKYEH